MLQEPIARTVYHRLYPPELDIQVALVIHPVVGVRIWCVGCTLAPTFEVFFHPDGLDAHIQGHANEHYRCVS